MKILKVIIGGELPNGCAYCYYLRNRERGRALAHECEFVDGWIEDVDTRPDWCPLEVETLTQKEYDIKQSNPYDLGVM